jgi:hypothetical protein
MRFRVWGYTDTDPEAPSILKSFASSTAAIAYAEGNGMAVEVEDADTGEILWTWGM